MLVLEHAALDDIETAALADLFRAAPQPLRSAHGIEARVLPAATLLMSHGIDPGVLFRRVVGLDTRQAATEDALDAALLSMDALGASYAVAALTDEGPATLAQWLLARGFRPGYAWMKFRRECVPAPAVRTDLDVRVAGPESAADFGRVVREGFGLQPELAVWTAELVGRPGWCCVMAFDGPTPVAAGAVFVRGEYAWLGLGATLASHRRRGAQNALLARRLQEAAARGARIAATETGERLPGKPDNSYRNILRSGFVEAYLRQNYMSPTRA